MATESSFTWKGAVIRVKALTIGDEEDVTALMLRVPDVEAEGNTAGVYAFAEFNVAAEVDGDLNYPFVSAASSDKEIDAARAAWRALPRGFLHKWRAALRATEDGSDDPK